jgi:3-phenylpropionate/cinnamic acid dioxygenase small subunit
MEFSDYHAIKNLIYRYAMLNDSGDFTAVGALFARANLYLPGQDQPAATSAQEIPQLWRKWSRVYPETGTPRTRHVITNVLIEAEGADRARAHSYFTVFQSTPDFPLQPICGGAYRDRFAREPGGDWHFIERREDMNLFGDLSHHLTMPYTEADSR